MLHDINNSFSLFMLVGSFMFQFTGVQQHWVVCMVDCCDGRELLCLTVRTLSWSIATYKNLRQLEHSVQFRALFKALQHPTQLWRAAEL